MWDGGRQEAEQQPGFGERGRGRGSVGGFAAGKGGKPGRAGAGAARAALEQQGAPTATERERRRQSTLPRIAHLVPAPVKPSYSHAGPSEVQQLQRAPYTGSVVCGRIHSAQSPTAPGATGQPDMSRETATCSAMLSTALSAPCQRCGTV